jgi:hypothetical protein
MIIAFHPSIRIPSASIYPPVLGDDIIGDVLPVGIICLPTANATRPRRYPELFGLISVNHSRADSVPSVT